jgi:hypothetical protein
VLRLCDLESMRGGRFNRRAGFPSRTRGCHDSRIDREWRSFDSLLESTGAVWNHWSHPIDEQQVTDSHRITAPANLEAVTTRQCRPPCLSFGVATILNRHADYASAVSQETPWGLLIRGLRDGTLGYRLVFRLRRSSPWPWLPARIRIWWAPEKIHRYSARCASLIPRSNSMSARTSLPTSTSPYVSMYLAMSHPAESQPSLEADGCEIAKVFVMRTRINRLF